MKYDNIKTLPNVGDVVVSKIMKIERKVIEVTNQKVRVRTNSDFLVSDSLLITVLRNAFIEYEKEFTHEEFFENHLTIKKEVSVQDVKVTQDDLDSVKYAFGELFTHHESGEKVTVGKVITRESGDNLIELYSEDVTFNGKAIEYQMSEAEFLDNFYRSRDVLKGAVGSTFTFPIV